MTPAVYLGDDPDARVAATDIEAADALGAVELVPREAQEVHVVGCDVHRDLARGLRAVDEEEGAALVAELAYLTDRVDGADLIVCPDDRHEDGVVAERISDRFNGDSAG